MTALPFRYLTAAAIAITTLILAPVKPATADEPPGYWGHHGRAPAYRPAHRPRHFHHVRTPARVYYRGYRTHLRHRMHRYHRYHTAHYPWPGYTGCGGCRAPAAVYVQPRYYDWRYAAGCGCSARLVAVPRYYRYRRFVAGYQYLWAYRWWLYRHHHVARRW